MTDFRHEVTGAIEHFNDQFGMYKAKTDERLTHLETRANRPLQAGASSCEDLEYAKSFEQYVRGGGSLSDVQSLERKALGSGSSAEGGAAVPEVIDSSIERLLVDISPIRRISRVVQVRTSDWHQLVDLGGMGSGWVGETTARPETVTPQFADLKIEPGEIYANPAATQRILDDAFFDVPRWLIESVAEEFAEQEGAAFINGDGTNKPSGFLSGLVTDELDAVRAFGTLQYISTGVDGGLPASDTDAADLLIDVVHTLRPRYRQNASWVLNSTTLSVLRKLKDGDGNFLWRPGLSENAPATLLGYPVIEAEDMPDVAVDSLAIAFGDFRKGYTIVEHEVGTRVLRDDVTNKPYVHFYTTRRVGGRVVNSEAIKLVRFSTS